MTDLFRSHPARVAILLMTGALLAAASACDTPPPTESTYSTPAQSCNPATPECAI